MVPAHNTFKLGYENILARLDNPPFHDLTNFMGYCEAWAVSIAGHHDSEEEVVFPVLNTKLDFSHEIEQHKVIHHHLDEILDIIHKAKDDHSEFDPAKLKSLMTSFKEPLYQHLDEEIEHITPDKMKVFDVQVMLKLDANLQKYVKAHGDPFLLVPYMRSHTPAGLKDTWPQMPWVLRKLVIPYVLARRYSGYWKYSPYGMS